jgi:hypothetical protein
MVGNGESYVGKWKTPFTLKVESEITKEVGQSVVW